MTNKLFGQRLREQRKQRGLSIEQLAEKLDITSHYLGDIERGLKYPSMDTFIRIVNVLEVPADTFLRDDALPSGQAFANSLCEQMRDLSPDKCRAVTEIMENVIRNVKTLK